MRLAKITRVFNKKIPVPTVIQTSLQLREGAELYIAPITSGDGNGYDGAELILSPIPPDKWRSICRFSARISERTGALAEATQFLRERNISIVLTEAASTFQERAHWDAICDLQYTKEYAQHARNTPLDSLSASDIENFMNQIVGDLDGQFKHHTSKIENSPFLPETDSTKNFTLLTGLNQSHIRCTIDSGAKYWSAMTFSGGNIEIPAALEGWIKRRLGIDDRLYSILPLYALLTGNSEQRYVRLLFLGRSQEFFRATITYDITKAAEDGVGLLNQFLSQLPEKINIYKFANHIKRNKIGSRRGYIEILGRAKDLKESEFRAKVLDMNFLDSKGIPFSSIFRLTEFRRPNKFLHKVYISYSFGEKRARIDELKRRLLQMDFEPVMGDHLSGDLELQDKGKHLEVPVIAFSPIKSCVALVSIQSPIDKYKYSDGNYSVPPWIIAEEAFAQSLGHRWVMRLRHVAVQAPGYNRHLQEYEYGNAACGGRLRHDEDTDFSKKVAELVRDLSAFRRSHYFENALKASLDDSYQDRWDEN